MCFYSKSVGVVAKATAADYPTRQKLPFKFVLQERFPWMVAVKDVKFFFDSPVVLDSALRTQLQAIQTCRPDGKRLWAWFVQGAHSLSEQDFNLLTRS